MTARTRRTRLGLGVAFEDALLTQGRKRDEITAALEALPGLMRKCANVFIESALKFVCVFKLICWRTDCVQGGVPVCISEQIERELVILSREGGKLEDIMKWATELGLEQPTLEDCKRFGEQFAQQSVLYGRLFFLHKPIFYSSGLDGYYVQYYEFEVDGFAVKPTRSVSLRSYPADGFMPPGYFAFVKPPRKEV